MKAKFDIQVNLNGWMIPFHIERKGYGIFKVAYENMILGHLMLSECTKWLYIRNVAVDDLLNVRTRNKISAAIINY